MKRKSAVVKYAGYRIRKRKYASGKTAWQLDMAQGARGQRKRETYDTLDEATLTNAARCWLRYNRQADKRRLRLQRGERSFYRPTIAVLRLPSGRSGG